MPDNRRYTRLLALSGAMLAALGFSPAPAARHAAHADAIAPSADSAAYLQRLVSEYDLAAVVRGATTDWDRMRLLSKWVRSRWEHNGSNEPTRPDPISILQEAQTGKQFRCVEYAEVLAAALSAVGVPARVLNLKTADVETRKSGAGHVVTEAYLRDLHKWAMVDGQWDIIPVRTGVPLNAVELQHAIAERAKDLTVESLSGTSKSTYVRWVTEYLYFYDIAPRYWTTGVEAHAAPLMLVPAGVPAPTVFQRRFPLPRMTVTYSATEFYAPPKVSEPAQ